MERRSGNVKSAQRSMRFSLIGKLTPKLVVLENTDVIVEPFFPGILSTNTFMN